MRILGLDLSLRSTGYVLLDEDQVVWSGVVGSDTLREAARLAIFDDWIRNVLGERRPGGLINGLMSDRRPDCIAIEGYSFDSKFQGQALGELGGVIKLAIHQAGVPMTTVAPGIWKKALCGNGQLKKDLVRLELYKRYAIEFLSQDTLDAWAVAMCLRRQLLGLNKPEPKSRRRTTLQQTLPSPVLTE